MEVGVVVWVKGKGPNAGWLEGTLVAKVLFFLKYLIISSSRLMPPLQCVLMKLVKISPSRE